MTLRLRTDGISWQEVDDSVVVLDLSGSLYFRLNGTGAFLWSELAEGREREQLVEALTSEYDVADERANADVDAFLGQLESANLLAQD